nr:MAG TPA: hypothetical protein [Caudoviricetes sp.]DAH90732.1 MAG TPA: hypothetical protein [Caudoviricetes sp.]DAM19661.1 MAG TPA: hypothetical protein [Caudoviricetes sp.]
MINIFTLERIFIEKREGFASLFYFLIFLIMN